jgi:hypothetical protein
MQFADCTRPIIGALALGAALCLTPALALAKDTSSSGKIASPLGSVLSGAPNASAQGAVPSTTYTFDTTNIISYDGEGAAINEIHELQVGANSRVVGIGWDVNLTAWNPSWLSELVVSFGPSSGALLYLPPGAGDNFTGSASYSSGGVVDLVGLGYDFSVGADGKLRMEFFEAFDDVPGSFDGTWNFGTLTFEVTAVPEPATYGMKALGLLAVGAAARRRRG